MMIVNEETKNTLDYINEFMNVPLEQIYLNRKRIKLVLNYITDLQQENARLKEDINNIINILRKNCDDLEATEEEFESLYKWQNE